MAIKFQGGRMNEMTESNRRGARAMADRASSVLGEAYAAIEKARQQVSELSGLYARDGILNPTILDALNKELREAQSSVTAARLKTEGVVKRN